MLYHYQNYIPGDEGSFAMDLKQEWEILETQDSDEEFSHRSPNEEFAFYRAVSSGDLEYVRKNCEQQKFLDMSGVGKLSKDPLTNLKYHFVVTTAFVVRFCMRAGMEMEQAYRLSDFYILKLDSIHTLSGVASLHSCMVLDLCCKMRLLQKHASTSKAISDCVDYVYAHLTERITIEDLAEHVALSPSYLSRLFKQEIGISVSDYIREKKLDRAQNLLRYTEHSFAEIANMLSFSSQSHFIQTFKNHTGMTPKKYRDSFRQGDVYFK